MLTLDIAYNHTKFDDSSLKDGYVALPRPPSGAVCCHRLGYAKINLPTKFEVPISTRYGNIKYLA